MEGVTTAIVGFIFVCLVFPSIVKNKPQYYAAFAAVVLVILLSGLEAVIDSTGFHAYATFVICVMQVSALILLTLSVGGLSFKQFAGEVADAIEVIRRGETKKEIIIPLRGQQPASRPPDPPASPASPASPPNTPA
jgi:hypothetical protein